MACDSWRSKIEPYADEELSAEELRVMAAHLRSCASCSVDVLARMQMKRSIKTAGKRYSPSVALRQRVAGEIAPRKKAAWLWNWMPALAATAALAVVAFLLVYGRPAARQGQTLSELADLHVATLASASPVDVISTDRHTVKPWFQGRIPFTFNLPELGNSPFTLEGGRVSYLDQSPGAQLIYKVGSHRISVFIFQNRADRRFTSGDGPSKDLTFNVETWTEGDLRYFVIGDANADDIRKLSELLKLAAKS
jgi:anti-sigma factor RsiW